MRQTLPRPLPALWVLLVSLVVLGLPALPATSSVTAAQNEVTITLVRWPFT